MPTTTIEVAFTTDPGTAPSWTDISSRLVKFTVNRGRQRELDRFAAGRATITLSNEDRALDPSYAGSAYYPNIVPMRRIRIRATYNAVTYDVFNGYVDGWEQQYQPPQAAVCVVQATDAFKVLTNIELLSSAYAEEVRKDIPTMWWRMGDPVGSTAATDAATGNLPLGLVGTPTFGGGSLAVYDPDGAVTFATTNDGLQGVFSAGTFPFTTALTIEFEYRYTGGATVGNQQYITAATIGTVNRSGIQIIASISGNLDVFVANNTGAVFEVLSTGVNVMDGSTHHVTVVVAMGSAIRVYIDGGDRAASSVTPTGTMANTTDAWIAYVNATNYPGFVFPGSTAIYDEVAYYTTALAAGRVAAHASARSAPWAGDTSGARVGRLLDAADWPAADRNIDTGVSILLPASLGGTALSLLQKVEETEQGAMFVTAAGLVRFIARDNLLKAPYVTSQATFGDSGSELEYGDLGYVYDDSLIVNDVQVAREGGITQVVGDSASQTKYLRRSKAFDGMLYQTDSDARDLANWWLSHYKEPSIRATGLKLEPSAGNETTHFPQALGRELMERVTVLRRPQNLGAAVSQDVLIEGITHNVTAMEWVTTWNLSPAETQVYWILGVAGSSELGVTTRLGF